MEYSVELFANKLKEWFANSALFPYYEIANTTETAYGRSKQYDDKSKHPNRNPTHLKDATKQCLDTSTFSTESTIEFNYGNSVLETNYPHYHILEDTQVIRKRNRGTKKSKGSQDNERIFAKRDYGKVKKNGKIFSKEYSRNNRGSRNRMSSVTHWGLRDLQSVKINPDANSYWNIHYKYIENILDNDVVIRLSTYFGLKLKRKQDTGLAEEYAEQEGLTIDQVIDTFESFDIGE